MSELTSSGTGLSGPDRTNLNQLKEMVAGIGRLGSFLQDVDSVRPELGQRLLDLGSAAQRLSHEASALALLLLLRLGPTHETSWSSENQDSLQYTLPNLDLPITRLKDS